MASIFLPVPQNGGTWSYDLSQGTGMGDLATIVLPPGGTPATSITAPGPSNILIELAGGSTTGGPLIVFQSIGTVTVDYPGSTGTSVVVNIQDLANASAGEAM